MFERKRTKAWVVDWQSKKLRRAVRSSVAAETLAGQNGLEDFFPAFGVGIYNRGWLSGGGLYTLQQLRDHIPISQQLKLTQATGCRLIHSPLTSLKPLLEPLDEPLP